MSARPGAVTVEPAAGERTGRRLVARRRAFDSIAGETWDALVDRSPAATPFSRHCVQRAWWDAYGDTAHDQTLVVVDEAAPDEIVGIAPLMHRHELEPGDVAARTTLRHQAGPVLRPVPASATAVFFGASYHADYATILAAPADLPGVCDAVVGYLAAEDPSRWDAVDLRRLRAGDPATDALVAAFEWVAPRGCWLVTREQEEVCPVLALPAGIDFEGYLGTLEKKERHEIRRKIRRAEAAGPIELRKSEAPFADLEAFIDLHQKRWGDGRALPGDTRRSREPPLLRGTFRELRADRDRRAGLPDGRRAPHCGRRDPRRRPDRLLLQRRRRAGRQRAFARSGHGRVLHPTSHRAGSHPARLHAWQRALQVRMGRGRRADRTAARPADGRAGRGRPR